MVDGGRRWWQLCKAHSACHVPAGALQVSAGSNIRGNAKSQKSRDGRTLLSPWPDCHRREGVAPSVWLPVMQTHFSFPPAPFLKLMKPWLKKASLHQPGRHPGRPRLAPSDRLSDSSFPNATATEITPLNELLPAYLQASMFPREKQSVATRNAGA